MSTSAKVTPQDFDERKEQFLHDANVIVNYEEIPDSLVVNWDHTGIKYTHKLLDNGEGREKAS